MSEIIISKQAYFHNLTQIANKVGSKDKIFAVLKDNAYGHGAKIMAKMASEFGIKTAVVKSQNEAEEISEFFSKIIILSHIPNGDESDKFIYAINSLQAIKSIKPKSIVHLAIDTLMHRNGLNLNEISEAFEIAQKREISISGAYTHFRSSDEMSGDFFVQKQNFSKAKAQIISLCEKYQMPKPIFHSHNSAAVERDSEFDEGIRVGIAQFGYAQFDESLNLKPVLSLWANKISDRILKKGQSVGYGGVFSAPKDMKIASYDLGYGDGLLRYNGIGELKLSDGTKMLGKMSMDSFSCEDRGDKICVFDDARVFAEFFGTISYDILVKLKPNIKRTLKN